MIENLGLDFISRTIRTTAVVLFVVFLYGLYYFDFYINLAILSGGVWSIVNMLLLSTLIRSALTPGEVDKMKVAGLALVKFPLLYVSGYYLLTSEIFDPLYLLIGFSILMAVIVLKVIARALFDLDKKKVNIEPLQEAR